MDDADSALESCDERIFNHLPRARADAGRKLVYTIHLIPPGGHLEERSPFELSFTGALTFAVAEGKLSIALEINTANGPDTRHLASVPVTYFGNPAVLHNFLQDLKRNYFKALRPAVEDEAFLLINDVRSALCGRYRQLKDVSVL